MGTQSRLAGERGTRYFYQPPPLPTETIKLAALGAAFPDFVFFVTVMGSRRAYGALRVRGDGPLLVVAAAGAVDLWRILRRSG